METQCESDPKRAAVPAGLHQFSLAPGEGEAISTFVNTPKYLLPFTSLCLTMAASAMAQTAAPAAPAAATPAAPAAATPATTPPAADAAAAPAGRAAAGRGAPAAPQPWPRPADGKPLFTEDFESGTLNDKVWTLHVAGNPTATIVQDNIAHGKNALKIHYPQGTTSREWAFVGMAVPEALREHYYGRVYVYMNIMPTGHCVLMNSGTTGFPISDFLEIGIRQNQFQPSFQLNKPMPPERPRGEKTYLQGAPPVGRWFCLEWEFIDKPDRIVLWIDGKLAVNQPIAYQIVKPAGPTVDSGLVGGFSELVLGYRSWTTAARDVDIYYDDIAIGDKPIGQLSPVAAPAVAPATATPTATTTPAAK